MTKSIPQVKIVDLETGEEIVRDANAAEIAQIEADVASYANKKADAAAKETAKAALLNRLGITAEEAQLLLS